MVCWKSGGIASKLRRSSIVSAPPTGLDRVDPGVVIFDQEGSVVSMTEAARQSLDLFATNQLLDVDGVSLPPEAYIVAARARAQACGRIGPDPIARASAGGVRLTIRASCTHAPDGSLGETVLVIEPARSRDLLPLIVDAFELSQREEEVVARVLAGDSAKQIASRLFISVHTVRDHIKSIYEKTGVGSRPELTRLLIDTHYLPIADTRHGRPQPDHAPRLSQSLLEELLAHFDVAASSEPQEGHLFAVCSEEVQSDPASRNPRSGRQNENSGVGDRLSCLCTGGRHERFRYSAI
jgi:DNA-binding CsgD family transcriptional regulator